MIHNTVKGVYGVGGFGAITVQYPVGSTCTCKYGTTTLSGDGSGLNTFFVPFSGAWVVKATSGALSAQETVNITSLGENKFIILAFTFDANISYDFLSPYVYGSTSRATITDEIASMRAQTNTYATFYTTNKITLTGYSKIRVHVYDYINTGSTVKLCIVNTPISNPSAAEKSVTINSTGWFEISLSDITGDYYVQFGVWLSGGSSGDVFKVDQLQFVA